MKSRRAKIRLADPEIDDVAARGGELRCARKHGKGIFLADAVEGCDGTEHALSIIPALSCAGLARAPIKDFIHH